MSVMNVSDLQEVQTLPRGCREVSSIWYAQNRMPYSTMANHVWTCASNQWFFHLGRVMEKSCMYALSIVQDIFEHINWRELKIETVVVWTDGPRQFRNRRWLGTLVFLELRHRGWEKFASSSAAPSTSSRLATGSLLKSMVLGVRSVSPPWSNRSPRWWTLPTPTSKGKSRSIPMVQSTLSRSGCPQSVQA